MHHTRSTASLLTVMCLLLASACGGYTPTPIHPSDDPNYNPGGVKRTGMKDDPPLALTLRSGDTVTVRTISNESFTYDGLIVDSEGKVHVPTAGAIVVADLTPAQAERRLEEVLQKYDRFVRVSVLVTAWGGHYATVLGAVVNEGTFMLTPGIRVAELLAQAGGPLRSSQTDVGVQYIADLDAGALVRDGKTLPVSIRKALQGVQGHNVLVHPGDQLFLPAALGTRITVLGMIGRGGAMLPYRTGMRLTEALASSGGLTIDSDDDDVRVVRGPLENPTVYVSSLEDLVEGYGTDVELAPGDIVFVGTHWSAKMGEVLQRIAPLLNVIQTGINTALLINTINQNNQQQPAPAAAPAAADGG